MTADITLRGPGDVVTLLPYQLGYHPRDSVVVVSLRGKRVGLVARCDLPPEQHVGQVVTHLIDPLLRDEPTSVILVGYEGEVDASRTVLWALADAIAGTGIPVADVVVVRGGRWFSRTCAEPCCPPGGVPLPDPADVPGVAEYVAMGRSPLRSRHAVADLVEPEPWRCTGVEQAIGSRSRMPRRRRRSAAAWAAVLRPPTRAPNASTPPDPATVADLALGLADVAWRDGLIAWLAPGVLPLGAVDPKVSTLLAASLPRWGGMGPAGRPPSLRLLPDPGSASGARPVPSAFARTERALPTQRDALHTERDALLHRLLELCRSVPDACPAEASAVCTVAAHVAWVDGDGARARVAVDRAVRLAPDYRLADLLAGLVDRGLRLPRGEDAGGRRGVEGRAG